MADAEGRLPSADELASCLECEGLVGGFCDESCSSGTVRRSLSAPHQTVLDSSAAAGDSQSKYHCDVVARNGSDVYRYPSPLHAVAVQSPAFLQVLSHGGHGKDEGLLKSSDSGVEGLKPESAAFSTSISAPVVAQSCSWSAPPSSSSQTPSYRRLDSYIYGLLQRRALPVRTSRPRTSISTDPCKGILRQTSLCVRQLSGPGAGSGLGTLRGSEFKPSWSASESVTTLSPQKQWSVEGKSEELEAQNVFSESSVDAASTSIDSGQSLDGSIHTDGTRSKDNDTSTNSLLQKKNKRLLSTAALQKDSRELPSPKANSSSKDTPDPDLKSPPPVVKTGSAPPKSSLKPQTERVSRSLQEVASVGCSSQNLDDAGGDGRMVSAKYIPAQNGKVRKGGTKNVKTVKVKKATEHTEPISERRSDKHHHRSGSKKSRLPEDGGSVHLKVSKRTSGASVSSARIKRLPASIPEGRILDKHNSSTLSSSRSGASRYHHHGNHHHNSANHHHHHHSHHHGHLHHHGRDQVVVVAKPKYKRNDYRRLRAIMEVPYDEAFRRAQRRQRKELLSHSAASVYLPSSGQLNHPYSYAAGSDSEYSAECASLFHSTVVDTSEDERSNYTTNCFGDSESSEEEEYLEESTTTSDTEESGGGGAGGGTDRMGRGWSQVQVGATGSKLRQDMTPAQAKAFVKIKASHNLKKKILRFRSGSLKLMTTV
ncbi:uncharacterized protein V6R79_023415 [Siganus canaliculatus]